MLTVCETRLFPPFYTPKDCFAKTGSGQKSQRESTQKKEALFSFSGNGTLDHDEFRDGLKALKVRKL
jgi:predicted alternative tryptophan synthase beta-subunit